MLGRGLGGELLRLRDAAAKTQQQAAEVISATNSKIVKMERGWVPMRDPDIRALCEFYGLADRKPWPSYWNWPGWTVRGARRRGGGRTCPILAR